MNIHGIKKHIQETKRELKKYKDGNYTLERRLKILQRVLKAKRKKGKKLKGKK